MGFPLFHGIPGSLARAFAGPRLLLPPLALLATWLLVASGIDDSVRGFFLSRTPLVDPAFRGYEFALGVSWPLVPAFILLHRGVREKSRALLAGGCAIFQAVIVLFIMTMTLKWLTGRPTPTSFEPARAFMWPSGHTTESFGAASAIVAYWRHDRRLAAISFLLATCVAGDMLVSSFHWLSDIVAAILLATPIGWTVGTTLRAWVQEAPAAG
jgi:membrane-associated phospholipid phosphatase